MSATQVLAELRQAIANSDAETIWQEKLDAAITRITFDHE